MDTLDSGFQEAGLTPEGKNAVNSTVPWLKFIAIFSIIISALGIIGGIAALMMSPIIGFMYLIIFGVAIYLSILLIQSSNHLAAFGSTGNPNGMNQYFILNKRYWMIVGILLIVYIVLIIIAFAVGGAFWADMVGRGF